MESQGASQKIKSNAWLIRLSGRYRGTRHLLRDNVFRIGRDPGNNLVLDGEEAAIVSALHLEIRREGDSYSLHDLGSRNGTFLDGQRISGAPLESNSLITLGPNGPQFQFELETLPASDLKKTVVVSEDSFPREILPGGEPPVAPRPAGISIDKGHEELLKEAVAKARLARRKGAGGQTALIMREMLGRAIHRSSKKFKLTIAVLFAALMAVTVYAGWTIEKLKRQKTNLDVQINQIERKLQVTGTDPGSVDALVEELKRYQTQASAVQKNLLFRLGARSGEQDSIELDIKKLMAEFGAEEYSTPPEFVEQVRRFIRQYQERDREHMARALGRSRKDLEAVRTQLQNDNLPPDLAYMVLVESAFITADSSSAGAAGLWQFTPATAKAYGLRVTTSVDDRLDAGKSTQATARYIRELILDFGSGSSVMLALAAYNLGPGKVKRAVRTVEDPIKQRNFWYLYRVRALPEETREYIPKVIAAIIIGRNPARFGF